MGNYMLERVFTMMIRQDDGSYKILYPRTTAEQVMATDITLKEHCTDFLSHIWETERRLLNNANRPNGYVLLEENGYLGENRIRQELLAINKEYATIGDLLNESRCQPGKLVMVLDATSDPSVDEGWAIYRRTKDEAYFDLLRGWEKVSEQEAINIDLHWENVKDKPTSSIPAIDQMIRKAHVHVGLKALHALDVAKADSIFDHDYFSHAGKRVGEDANIVQIYVGAVEKPVGVGRDMVSGDFWYKPSIGQSWWFDSRIEEATDTCYEKFRDQEEMTESPKLRTNKTKVMRRMFYRCENLTLVNQYDTRNVTDFTGMFYECHNLREVPPFYSHKGKTFDSMFYGCNRLLYGPELDLRSATTTAAMFSGCENMKRIVALKNTGNVADMREMFNGCRSLEVLPVLDVTGVTTDEGLTKTFNECFSLREVYFKPGSLTCSLSLENTKVDMDCIRKLFEGLPTITTRKVINLINTPGIGKLTAEDREVATRKGWIILPAL